MDSGGTKTYKRDAAEPGVQGVGCGVQGARPAAASCSSISDFGFPISLGDRLGTFSRETDSTQATTATKQYDAFGMPLSSTGASVSPFGFAGAYGYQEDPDSSLKLLGHRYYDPSTGRFLTRDPEKDGRNWYVYCNNNPSAWADPLGLRPAPMPPSRIDVLPTKNPWLSASDIDLITGCCRRGGSGFGSDPGNGAPDFGNRYAYGGETGAPYAAPGGVSEAGAGGMAGCEGLAVIIYAVKRDQGAYAGDDSAITGVDFRPLAPKLPPYGPQPQPPQ